MNAFENSNSFQTCAPNRCLLKSFYMCDVQHSKKSLKASNYYDMHGHNKCMKTFNHKCMMSKFAYLYFKGLKFQLSQVRRPQTAAHKL